MELMLPDGKRRRSPVDYQVRGARNLVRKHSATIVSMVFERSFRQVVRVRYIQQGNMSIAPTTVATINAVQSFFPVSQSL